jgi:hypothetical protein
LNCQGLKARSNPLSPAQTSFFHEPSPTKRMGAFKKIQRITVSRQRLTPFQNSASKNQKTDGVGEAKDPKILKVYRPAWKMVMNDNHWQTSSHVRGNIKLALLAS